MKKKHTLVIVILALAAAVAVLAGINRAMTEAPDAGAAEVAVYVAGERQAVITLDWIRTLAPQRFDDQIKETGAAARGVTFTGVELREAVEALGLDTADCRSVSFRGGDGYVSAASIEEVAQAGKVYLVYERDGVQTRPKEQGGTGPMEIVIADEAFSLRNCKFLVRIDFEAPQGGGI